MSSINEEIYQGKEYLKNVITGSGFIPNFVIFLFSTSRLKAVGLFSNFYQVHLSLVLVSYDGDDDNDVVDAGHGGVVILGDVGIDSC